MALDHAICQAATRAKDARFDGTFYIAVKTTGIYCRPICPARSPKPENVTFYETASAAEAAGYRPCLRCRPELSPSVRSLDGGFAREFVNQVQRDGLFGQTLESAAARLGISSRHLRRMVEEECGVSPVEVVRTTRLLFARRLLSSTKLPVSSVAFGSGFGSLARFNYSFRAQYGVAPSAFRKRTQRRAVQGRGIHLALAYREPFAWDHLLRYWSKRAIPGVEAIHDRRYWRTVRIGDRVGWFSAGIGRNAVDVEVSDELATHLLPLAGRIRAMFDLETNPGPIAAALGDDPVLGRLVEATPGLRVPGAFDGFELAIRAILGQQVSVAAASTLAGRLVRRFAQPAPVLPAGLSHYPLTAESLAGAELSDIAEIGIPASRAATLRGLAQAALSGSIDFEHASATIQGLKAIPGIGDWTRDYIAMRALRQPDAFPCGDLGLRKAVTNGTTITARALEEISQRWRPWRAYAAVYLWTAPSESIK